MSYDSCQEICGCSTHRIFTMHNLKYIISYQNNKMYDNSTDVTMISYSRNQKYNKLLAHQSLYSNSYVIKFKIFASF